jgi:hypothetical protein
MSPEDVQYIDRLRDADRKYFEAEITAVRRAVDVLSGTNDKRWENANEFRGQLKDQAAQFITRQEFSQVKDSVSTFVTRAELWGAVGAAIAFGFGLMQLLKQ